jgi:site-specific DNA recombinase
MSADRKPVMRCAIYTRKSSEEGLEQSFNSLDAQREACEAFIASQRPEGWQAMPTRYDDGGYSGGSMERPALKRLLEDIAANKINATPDRPPLLLAIHPALRGVPEARVSGLIRWTNR